MKLTGIWEENREYFKNLLPESTKEEEVCVGAIEDGKAVAAAVFSASGSLLYLDHIYVDEKYRKKGIGSTLIKEFAYEMQEAGIHSINVLFTDKAKGIDAFLVKTGFGIVEEGAYFSAKIEDFLSAKKVQKIMSGSYSTEIRHIKDLSKTEKNVLSRYLTEDDADPDILTDPALAEKLSFVSVDSESGNPHACVLCERTDDDVIVEYLGSFMKDLDDLAAILSALFKAGKDEGLSEKTIRFAATDERIIDFAGKLLDDPKDLKRDGTVYSAMLCM